MALKYHIKHYRGTAFFIHSDDRVILANGLKLDPNRIFSTKGTKKTLLKYHPKVSMDKKKAIVFGNFVFNISALRLKKDSNDIYLTEGETKLLLKLIDKRNNIVLREELADRDFDEN